MDHSAADELLDALSPTVNYREKGDSMVGIKRVSYTHDGMIDLIVGEPGISQGAIAKHFGYSEPWISQIIASDAFQERLAARKNDLIDPVLRATVEEKIKALYNRSVEVLMEKLHRPAAQVSDQLAIRAAELGARSLGLGREQEKTAPVNVDKLVILADRLIVLQRNVVKGIPNETTIEGTVLSRESGENADALRGQERE